MACIPPCREARRSQCFLLHDLEFIGGSFPVPGQDLNHISHVFKKVSNASISVNCSLSINCVSVLDLS